MNDTDRLNLEQVYGDCQNAIWAAEISFALNYDIWGVMRQKGCRVDDVVNLLLEGLKGALDDVIEMRDKPRGAEWLRRYPLVKEEALLPSFRRYVAGKLGLV